VRELALDFQQVGFYNGDDTDRLKHWSSNNYLVLDLRDCPSSFDVLCQVRNRSEKKLATGCISAEPIESLRLPPEIFDTGGQLGVVSSLGGFGRVSDPPELRAFCRSFRRRVSAFVSTVQSGKN
jgi:hypothetical protein